MAASLAWVWHGQFRMRSLTWSPVTRIVWNQRWGDDLGELGLVSWAPFLQLAEYRIRVENRAGKLYPLNVGATVDSVAHFLAFMHIHMKNLNSCVLLHYMLCWRFLLRSSGGVLKTVRSTLWKSSEFPFHSQTGIREELQSLFPSWIHIPLYCWFVAIHNPRLG